MKTKRKKEEEEEEEEEEKGVGKKLFVCFGENGDGGSVPQK